MTSRPAHTIRGSLILLMLATASAITSGQETADFFRQNCASCHTIGGGSLTGPDLKGATSRRDRAWLATFITDPKAVIASGDAYAKGLVDGARGVVMPTLPGLDKARVDALITLIEEESKKAKSAFAGSQASDRPLTARDVELGRALFTGETSLANGGPPCSSCHSVADIGVLGGGRLAPDLTNVFERYQGRTVLATWLAAPATPTMASIFKTRALESEEVLQLVAFFQHHARAVPADPAASQLNFLLIGLAGALLLLALFEGIWHRRFRAVRRPMITGSKLENSHE